MSMNDENIVLGPGEGKTVLVPGHKIWIKLSGEDTDGAFSLLEVELTGDGPPQHIHKTEDETFYVLEGEVKFLLGEKISIAKKGTFVVIPRGTVHAWCLTGQEPAKLLATIVHQGLRSSLKMLSIWMLLTRMLMLLKPKH